MKTWLVVLGCCLLFPISCDNKKSEETARQLAAAQAENSALHQKISDLQSRIAALEAEHENLIAKHNELELWSRELVSALGPSVWTPGTYERPIPIQFYPKASVTQLVNALNQHFQSLRLPRIKLTGVEDRTAVVSIEDGEQLTQTMGTTGAQAYMGSVTYTLCSLKDVDCVEFRFKMGTHAVPGRYCR